MRLDQLLVKKGLANSRTQSQKLIQSGQVSVLEAGQWHVVTKPSQKMEVSTELQVLLGEEQKYASRAGLKLAGALTHLQLNDPFESALDIGQSTGGFTDCLLHNGVQHVVGVDVGRDQLIDRLRNDVRVSCLEKVNARTLSPDFLNDMSGRSSFNLIVMDVSFISQSHILPQLPPLLSAGAYLVSLVKPQFEVGTEGLGKGGIVRDSSLYAEVEGRLRKEIIALGLHVVDYFESSILGGDGNREFFICAQKQQG